MELPLAAAIGLDGGPTFAAAQVSPPAVWPASSWETATPAEMGMDSTLSIGTTAAGLAIADGLIAFEDRAQQHLPTFGLPPNSNAATGWLDDITLLQLATHTAGFPKSGGYTDLSFAPGIPAVRVAQAAMCSGEPPSQAGRSGFAAARCRRAHRITSLAATTAVDSFCMSTERL